MITEHNLSLELLQTYQSDNAYLRHAIDIAERMEKRMLEELQRKDVTITALEAELETVRMQVNNFENSTIWRMTAPIRKLLDFLKGFRKKSRT